MGSEGHLKSLYFTETSSFLKSKTSKWFHIEVQTAHSLSSERIGYETTVKPLYWFYELFYEMAPVSHKGRTTKPLCLKEKESSIMPTSVIITLPSSVY